MGRLRTIARRTFLIGSVAVVGGVAFGAYMVARPAPNPFADRDDVTPLTPFVFIDQNGITLIAPRAEMGQGVMTTLAYLIAEELDVDMNEVNVIHGPAAQAYYNGAFTSARDYHASDFQRSVGEAMGVIGKLFSLQVTGGSTSMIDAYTRLREAGAAARETLKEAAAIKLNFDRSELTTENGMVIAPNGTRLSYIDLAPDTAEVDVITGTELRPPSQWKYLGKSMPRVDMAGKATGTATFGIDVRLPGMRFAALRMNPRIGAVMRSFNADAALAMQGVERVIDLGGGFAVVANNTWIAREAANAVEAKWAPASYPATTERIFAQIEAAFDDEPNSTLRDDGDVEDLPDGAEIIEAEYRLPYLAHATMEPMNATALLQDGKLEIWCGTQGPTIVRAKCAEALDMDEDDISVNTTYLGGGYGRRGEFDYAVYAARVAAEMEGTPVQVMWSREEDMTHDFYRPGNISRFRGAVKDGKAVMLDGKIAAQSPTHQALARWGMPPPGTDPGLVEGAANQPYAIPNYRISGYTPVMDIPVGFWRSVGNTYGAFVHDTFIDELAHKAGADPLAFRYDLMKDEHAPAAGTLAKVREMSGWTGNTPDGIGRGVGFCFSFGTPVAIVLEVAERGGEIHMTRAWIACDMGTALDPEIVRAQMSGGMAYGLSSACFEEITFADGAVEQQNFPDYDPLRIHRMPEVEVAILETNPHMGGAGEPGTPPAAPALGNAIFDLTGKRARRLPLIKDFPIAI